MNKIRDFTEFINWIKDEGKKALNEGKNERLDKLVIVANVISEYLNDKNNKLGNQ